MESSSPPAPVCTFNADPHEYRIDGRIVNGHTGLLRKVGIIDERWFTEETRQRGDYAHRASALDDAGDLNEEELDPALWQYVNEWRRARAELKFKILAIEEHVFNIPYRYGATIDRRVMFPPESPVKVKGEAVLEIKTGAWANWHGIQLGLQALCYDRPLGRVTVYLPTTGKFKFEEWKDPRDLAVARAVVALAGWKAQNEGD